MMHCLDIWELERIRDLLVCMCPAEALKELQVLIDKRRKEHGYEVGE